jgi:hypothetical protein
MFRLNKRAQSTLEYAVLVFVIVAALITMQAYVKRGMQGRIRSSTDEIGEQYSPGYTTSDHTTTRTSVTKESVGTADVGSGVTKRDFVKDESHREGNETVLPWKAADGTDQEYWP